MKQVNIKIRNRMENGNIIDELGSIFVMIFIVALILVYTAYGRLTQERLAVNNIAKEYLYKMEEQGYLSPDDKINMENDLASEVDGITVAWDAVTQNVNPEQQVTYGDTVTLSFSVTFPNPLFMTFSRDESYVKIPGFSNTLTYPVSVSSTAKW